LASMKSGSFRRKRKTFGRENAGGGKRKTTRGRLSKSQRGNSQGRREYKTGPQRGGLGKKNGWKRTWNNRIVMGWEGIKAKGGERGLMCKGERWEPAGGNSIVTGRPMFGKSHKE